MQEDLQKKKKKDHGLHKEKRENGSPKDVYVNIFIFCLKKKVNNNLKRNMCGTTSIETKGMQLYRR